MADMADTPDNLDTLRKALRANAPEGGPNVGAAPGSIPAEWFAEFEAAQRRDLPTRFKYAFIKTYKPVLDDARFRAFETMRAYRDWCERDLPSWLGYGRV